MSETPCPPHSGQCLDALVEMLSHSECEFPVSWVIEISTVKSAIVKLRKACPSNTPAVRLVVLPLNRYISTSPSMMTALGDLGSVRKAYRQEACM